MLKENLNANSNLRLFYLLTLGFNFLGVGLLTLIAYDPRVGPKTCLYVYTVIGLTIATSV